ncbi:hypothetical protein PIROE2DRAFT_2554 [Piromyces sp. E2]|nr:hypothetical protein PIROE2DRAFT_2554 [Piromyces sp. E2]|eukprot:OUM69467.1 hypothetical protein PIROE2DRAFT_2554 [Piromyces sp. E2]
MKYLNPKNNKWQYLLFAIHGLSMITNINGKPLKFSFDINDKIGKIVQRYNIDVYKHRVKSVDFLEYRDDNEMIELDEAQKTRDYIKLLDLKEKNNVYNKKMNSKKDEFDEATDIKNKLNVIRLSGETSGSPSKKSIDPFNFHIFCIDSTMEKCEKIKTNLNSIGKSLGSQLEVKEPINVLVKTLSFCKSMNKDCGAVKTNAITTPTSFYSLTNDNDDTPYLYPQALVKQLDIEGSVDFTSTDINLTINTDIDYWYWVCNKIY